VCVGWAPICGIAGQEAGAARTSLERFDYAFFNSECLPLMTWAELADKPLLVTFAAGWLSGANALLQPE
jgi:hypothetical protein